MDISYIVVIINKIIVTINSTIISKYDVNLDFLLQRMVLLMLMTE